MKSVLYSLILLTTAVRFVDMIYLLTRDSTNLPLSVLLVTSAMILYGLVLLTKKFFGTVRLRQMMVFFGVQAALVVVNLVTVALFVPMQITLTETLIVGSFLDILIDCGALYAGFRFMRDAYHPFVRVVGKEQA
jgi:hypothetical protein